MEETPKPPPGKLCRRSTSLAWIEPNGKIHWLGAKHVHGTWAFVHFRPDWENSPSIPDDDGKSEMLLQEGWIRVSSIIDVEVRNIESVPQAAWDSWLSLVTECSANFQPEQEMMISTGRNVITDYLSISIGDFVSKYCSKGAQDAYWSKMMGESLIRNTVRSLLREDLAGFTSKTSGINYGRNDPKQLPRELKRIWSQEADHEFFKSLIKVHWIAGMPKSPYRVFEKMSSFLNASGKDEISTMGYIGKPSISQWGEFGIMVQGRTTLAANDMNAIVSGYYREIDPGEIEKYSKTSGLPRRASKFSPEKAKGFIFDGESFGRQYLGNELILDNWRPTGLIAPLWFINDLKKSVPVLGKRKLEESYENLVKLFVTSDLPVYTNNGTPKDMAPFKEMLRT
jgi:hypothetical protein